MNDLGLLESDDLVLNSETKRLSYITNSKIINLDSISKKNSNKESNKKILKQIIGNLRKNLESEEEKVTENLPFKKKSDSISKIRAISLKKDQQISENLIGENELLQDSFKYKTDINIRIPTNNDLLNETFENLNQHSNLIGSQIKKINNYLIKEERKATEIYVPDLDRPYLKMKNVYDSNDEVIDSKFEKSKFLIHPNSKFKIYWDLYFFMILLYSVIISSYRMGFSLNSNFSIFAGFEIIVEITFIFDFFLNFNISYYDKYENLISSREGILKNYASHWLIFDLISSYPSNLINLILLNDSSWKNSFLSSSGIKVFRWIKLQTYFETGKNSTLGKFFDNFSDLNDKPLARVIKFSIFGVFLLHISSCFWIYIGLTNKGQTWILSSHLTTESNAEIYIAAVYFNIVTVFTIGYGDIISTNKIERLFNIALMIGGGFLFSYAVSCLSLIFKNQSSRKIQKKEKIELLENYLKEYKIPQKLYKVLKKTIKYQIKTSNLDKYNILEDLSNNLKNDLHLVINKKYLNNFLIFENKPSQFILFVLPLLKPIITSRYDCLFSAGEFVEEIYFVKQGILSLKLDSSYDNIEIGEIRKNSHFGELLMYTNEKSPYSLKVKSKKSELYVLKKNDFSRAKLNFSNIVDEILSESYESLVRIEKKRKIFILIFEYEKRTQKIKNFFNSISYFLLEKNFTSIYETGEGLIDVFDYLANRDLNEISEILKNKLNISNLDKSFLEKFRVNRSINDTKLIQRLSVFKKNQKNSAKNMIIQREIHPEVILKVKKGRSKNRLSTAPMKGSFKFNSNSNVKKIENDEIITTEKSDSLLKNYRSLNSVNIKLKDSNKNLIEIQSNSKALKVSRKNSIKSGLEKIDNKSVNTVQIDSNLTPEFPFLEKSPTSEICFKRSNISERKFKSKINLSSKKKASLFETNLIDYSSRPINLFQRRNNGRLKLENIVEEANLVAIMNIHSNNIVNDIKEYLGNEDENFNFLKNARRSLKKLNSVHKILLKLVTKKIP